MEFTKNDHPLHPSWSLLSFWHEKCTLARNIHIRSFEVSEWHDVKACFFVFFFVANKRDTIFESLSYSNRLINGRMNEAKTEKLFPIADVLSAETCSKHSNDQTTISLF